MKRDTLFNDYGNNPEELAPVYQTSPIDYEELAQVMNQLYPYYEDSTGGDDNIHEDKRYLGKSIYYLYFIALLIGHLRNA